MKISFCMPLHNKEPYLASTIESVLGQSHRDFELVIVDDASTDGSWDVCQHFFNKSKKIKLIHNNKNVGVASARNMAWEAATGDIICPMDADDLAAKCRAGVTSRYFSKHPKIGLMYGSCGAIDQENSFIERRDSKEFSMYEMKKLNFIQNITVGCRRDLKVRYREGLKYIDDWYFYMDCIRAGVKFGRVLDIVGMFRLVPDGLTYGCGGFKTPAKLRKRVALKKEFADLGVDLTDKMGNPLQQYRLGVLKNKVPAGKKVLDVGCNTGYLMDMLKNRSLSVSGVEIASNTLDIVRKKGYRVYDGKEEIKTKFDVIIMADILEHHDEKIAKKLVSKYYGLLKQKGKLIITVPHKLGPYKAETTDEHVRDVGVEEFNEYKVESEALFYGNYAVPVWNLVVINK